MGASLALSARLGGGRRRRAGLDAAAGAGWVMVGASGLDERSGGAEARRALVRLDRGAEARRALARLDRGAEAPRALVRLDRGVLRAQFAPMEANEARCLASLVATLTNRLTAHADRAR